MPHETLIEHSETIAPPGRTTGAAAPVAEEHEVDVLAVTTILLRGKATILRFMLVMLVLTAIIVYGLMSPMYTADAVFLPPQTAPGSSMSQLASQIGSLGAMGALGGLKSPSDIYLGILNSRTVADSLVKRFDLQNVYKTKRLSSAIKKLEGRSTFATGKNTLITISVQDHDPNRAADLANGYLDALREQNGRLALTEAAQRRLFFEQQLEREKNSLADAEVEMKKTQEQTGLIAPYGQAQAEIETTAELRAQISSRQVALAALRQGATDENPQVVRLQSEIAGLQRELTKIQSDPSQHQLGSIQLPTAKVPELALEFVRKQREVKYHEVLFELIAKQYEAARLDESRDAPILQVVDRAVVPDRKSGPPRLLAMIGALLLGAILGSIWVLVKQYLASSQQDPVRAARLRELRYAATSYKR
jgi:capsule polysaccharide export protein KpsE/RkpR